MAMSAQALELGASQHSVTRFHLGHACSSTDFVAEEVPVALVFNGISHAVMMASPSDLDDFALGFAITEGLLQSPEDLYGMEQRDVTQAFEGHSGLGGRRGIELHLEVSAASEWRLKERRRTLAGRTGCGLCGADSLSQVHRALPPVEAVCMASTAVLKAAAALRERQPVQLATGATHAAAWVDVNGNILRVKEDVGRHNALDKLVGDLLRHQVSPSSGCLLITSRASFEMVQKAVAFGAGILAAVSAPTALAVEVAHTSNLALAGYVRGDELVAYSFPQRFEPSPALTQGKSPGIRSHQTSR